MIEQDIPAPSIAATLPIRSLHDGKRRLANHLTPDQRSRLIANLCTLVVRALRDSGVVDMIGLVSGDDRTLEWGRSLGLVPIQERGVGLNVALRTAGAWAAAAGAEAQLIVLPDLPLLHAADVRAVARRGAGAPGVVLCPDRSRTGTNVLLLRPCGAIPTMFGRHSFAHHVEAARAAGRAVTVYDSPGTSWDIDTPADLEALGLDL